jgi:hypothetical protein
LNDVRGLGVVRGYFYFIGNLEKVKAVADT